MGEPARVPTPDPADRPVLRAIDGAPGGAAEARRRAQLREMRRAPIGQPDTGPAHVSRLLWILLGLSFLFLGAVQVYVSRIENASAPSDGQIAQLSLIASYSPSIPVPRDLLELRWEEMRGATLYHLRIVSIDGSPVVDPMEVWENSWVPTEEVAPGLVPGSYRWTVEGLDSAGNVLARSLPTKFTLQ